MVSPRIAVTSVSYAITLLISKAQREELRIAHQQEGAEKRYRLYGPSFTKDDCQRGAKNLYQSLTKKEKRKKAIDAIIAQGKKPWDRKEIKAFKKMHPNPKYWVEKGTNAGLPDMVRLATELNRRFHHGQQVRTNRALSTYVRRHPEYF